MMAQKKKKTKARNKKYQKGRRLHGGKTKIIWSVIGFPDLVIIENKNDITAFDDPDMTKQFGTKAVCATATTCATFGLLNAAGLPTPFIKRLSETEFLAKKTKMIPLEVVERRLGVGSFCERNPQFAVADVTQTNRFHRLLVEFFLKTTHGGLKVGRRTLVSGLDAKKKEEDPLIIDPYSGVWELVHSKKPLWDKESDLGRSVQAKDVLTHAKRRITEMDEIARRVFLVLEGAWNTLGLRLIDLKIEFGFTADGELVVSDVIDSDSWRLWKGWEDFSKQSFRDGEDLSEVAKKYAVVAQLAQQLRIPEQVLVLWRGSSNDQLPNVPYKGVKVIEIVSSGHKAPVSSCQKLEHIMRDNPDGGAIVYVIGMSNGGGPTLSARTIWPGFSFSPTADAHPEDTFSNTRMPSNVPHPFVNSGENAIQAAMNVLAQKNPLIYMQRQFEIEELDKAA